MVNDQAGGRTAKQLAAEPEPWVLLARLVRPHGRRGEIIGDILTDFPERFQERVQVLLIAPEPVRVPERQMRVQNFWFLRSRIVLKFEGIDSINDAEALRGFGVAIPAHERAPLPVGSVYISDLIGCRLFDIGRERTEVGEVIDVDRGSTSTDLLVIRLSGRGREEALIPFVNDYLVQIDVDAKLIEMRLPEGLLEINAPMTEEEKQAMRAAKPGE